MRDPECQARVKQRISESKRRLDPAERRSELLKRNAQFMRELNSGPLKHTNPRNEEERQLGGWRTDDLTFHIILYRWGISSGWDGRDSTLDQYVFRGPSVLFKDPVSREEGMLITGRIKPSGKIKSPSFIWTSDASVTRDGKQLERGKEYPISSFRASVVETWIRTGHTSRGTTRRKALDPPSWAPEIMGELWSKEVENERAYIYVKISPPTSRQDYESIWPDIKKLKKRIFYSERTQRTFERDLCFWDLKHRPEEYGKLSFGDILNRWNGNAAAGRKVKNTDVVKKVVKSIQGYIDRLTPYVG